MSRLAWAIGLMVVCITVTAATAGQEPALPVFKSAVERVAISAVVRDSKGKLVKNLTTRDFVLTDSGRSRPLVGVWSEPSPASVAIVMDSSGSMATKTERARAAADAIIAGLQPGIDEVALYSFDTELTELRPFSKSFADTSDAWTKTRAFGATSLWDAIAATADQIAVRERRRAMIVITDGVDSWSKLEPAEVSAIANAVDVPVYMLVIGFLQDDGSERPAPVEGPLADFATWTGGDSALVHDPPSAFAATRQILTELHHQYIIAFEPGTAPGWHPIVIKTRKNNLYVRARSGYVVGALNQ